MSDCFCTKTYKCLTCEKGERALIVPKPKRIPKPRKIAQCGTRAGYGRHLNRGEVTCPACRKAQTEYVLEAKRKKAMK